jgi:hypothetical protein
MKRADRRSLKVATKAMRQVFNEASHAARQLGHATTEKRPEMDGISEKLNGFQWQAAEMLMELQRLSGTGRTNSARYDTGA